MKCRACKNDLNISFVKLGTSPPSNSYLIKENLKTPEKWFPLSVNVCSNCWLAQNAMPATPYGEVGTPNGATVTVHQLLVVDADVWTISLDVWSRGGVS